MQLKKVHKNKSLQLHHAYCNHAHHHIHHGCPLRFRFFNKVILYERKLEANISLLRFSSNIFCISKHAKVFFFFFFLRFCIVLAIWAPTTLILLQQKSVCTGKNRQSRSSAVNPTQPTSTEVMEICTKTGPERVRHTRLKNKSTSLRKSQEGGVFKRSIGWLTFSGYHFYCIYIYIYIGGNMHSKHASSSTGFSQNQA